jgi:hypothetical protein
LLSREISAREDTFTLDKQVIAIKKKLIILKQVGTQDSQTYTAPKSGTIIARVGGTGNVATVAFGGNTKINNAPWNLNGGVALITGVLYEEVFHVQADESFQFANCTILGIFFYEGA